MLKLIKNFASFCLTKTVYTSQSPISKFEMRNFADRVKLHVKAGNGGSGTVSYFTDKRIRKGKPDGGNGGNGGDIVLEAHDSIFDLSHLRKKSIHGNNGNSGKIRGQNGKNGGKIILRVPCGTFVYEIQNKDLIQQKKLVAQLNKNCQSIVIAKGGQMGKGNKLFPGMYEDDKYGKIGQQKLIFLQLKSLADVGLVGLPNIGKSTFLAAVSRAMPKIANYEFTTLRPSIGIVKFQDNFMMTVADLPGIIEDSHKNKGLGFEFLRHIQRTKVLLFMLDITHDDPIGEFKMLLKQLFEYKKQLFIQKKRILAFNKSDCLRNIHKYQQIVLQLKQQKCFLISAKESDNVGPLLIEIKNIVQQLRQQQEKQRVKETETIKTYF